MALQNKKCLCVVSAISDYHYVKAAGVPAVVVCMFWVRAEVYGTEDQLTASQLCDLHSTHTNSIEFSCLGFDVPLNTRQVISETIFLAYILTGAKHPQSKQLQPRTTQET